MTNTATIPGVLRFKVKRLGCDTILLYRLTEKWTPNASPSLRISYSITVTMIDEGGTRRQVKCINDITRSRAKAEWIFEKVFQGLVTPCTLDEVVYDLICI